MVKQHLKRLATPPSWNILRKQYVFITKPNSGAHSYRHGLSLNTFFKEVLHLCKTRKEVKRILHDKQVFVDGKLRHDERFIVGFMDVVSIPATKQYYRLSYSSKGKITAVSVSEKEAALKAVKILGKRIIKGKKMQLSLAGGRTILVNEDYPTGGSLMVSLPKQEVKGHYALEAGAQVIVWQGKRRGAIGTVVEVVNQQVIIKSGDETFKTKKAYAYVIGDKKPLIKVAE